MKNHEKIQLRVSFVVMDPECPCHLPVFAASFLGGSAFSG